MSNASRIAGERGDIQAIVRSGFQDLTYSDYWLLQIKNVKIVFSPAFEHVRTLGSGGLG